MIVKQSKKIEIVNKIFKLNDLQNIARLFNDEYEDSKSNNLNPSMSFEVYNDKDSVYESSDSALFSDELLFSTLSVHMVKMNLRSNDFSTRRLELMLKPTSSNYFSDNNITIYGYDSNWVNGVTARLNDILESIQPQSEYKRFVLRLSHFLSALVIGRIFIFLILILSPSKPDLTDMSSTTLAIRSAVQYSSFTYNISIYLLSFIFGFFPAIEVRLKLRNIFPNIEFQIGPEHKQLAKRKRNKLIQIFIFIVIPLMLMLLYDIIKNNI